MLSKRSKDSVSGGRTVKILDPSEVPVQVDGGEIQQAVDDLKASRESPGTRSRKPALSIDAEAESPKARSSLSKTNSLAHSVLQRAGSDHDEELLTVQREFGYLLGNEDLQDLRDAFRQACSEVAEESGDRGRASLSLQEVEDLLWKLGFVSEGRTLQDVYSKMIHSRKVTVRVESAEGLAARDSNGLSDPFVEVHLGSQVKSTDVCPKTLEPVWSETLEFDYDRDHMGLEVFVFDHDHGFIQKKNFLGAVTLKLEGLDQFDEHQWYQVQDHPKYSQTGMEVSGKLRMWVLVDAERRKEAGDEDRLTFRETATLLAHDKMNQSSLPPQKIPWFPFDPEASWKETWDIIVMIMLLYTTFAVPYMLAFGSEPISFPLTSYQIWDLVLDGVFCVDIVLSFCTAITLQGVYVTNLAQIARIYIRGWFLIDLPGSVPFDKIATLVASGEDLGPTLKTLKFIRILKMVRAVRFLRKLNQLEEKDRSGVLGTVLKVFRSIFLMGFSAHFLGCMYYMLLDTEDDQHNWLKEYDPEMGEEHRLGTRDNFEHYTLALYWALATVSTIGYGDVTPVRHEERMFSNVVAVVGVIVFAFAMGNISSLMSQDSGVRKRFEEKMTAYLEYMEFRNASTTLKRLVSSHFGSCWRHSGDLHHEVELLKNLPGSIRKEVLLHLAELAEKQVAFLSGLDTETIAKIFMRLVPQEFRQGTFVYRKGEHGGEMFFVTRGSVRVRGMRIRAKKGDMIANVDDLVQMKTVDRATELGIFGDLSVFPDICQFRTEDVQVNEDLNCLVLTREALEELKQVTPVFYEKLHQFCSLRAARLGVNNEVMQEFTRNQSRGIGLIDRLNADMVEDLLDRHERQLGTLRTAQPLHFNNDSSPKTSTSSRKRDLGHSDVQSWVVTKSLNTFQKGTRQVTLDNVAKTFSSGPLEAKSASGGRKPGASLKEDSKVKPVDSILSAFRIGTVGTGIKVEFIDNHRPPYEFDFETSQEADQFMEMLNGMLYQVRQKHADEKNQFIGSLKSPSKSRSVPKKQADVHRGWLLTDSRGPLQELPNPSNPSVIWQKISFVFGDDRTVHYMTDAIDHLRRGRTDDLGKLTYCGHNNIPLALRIISVPHDSGFVHGAVATVLPIKSAKYQMLIIGTETPEEADTIYQAVVDILGPAGSGFLEPEQAQEPGLKPFRDWVSSQSNAMYSQGTNGSHNSSTQVGKKRTPGKGPPLSNTTRLRSVLEKAGLKHLTDSLEKARIDDKALELLTRSDCIDKLGLELGDALKLWGELDTGQNTRIKV